MRHHHLTLDQQGLQRHHLDMPAAPNRPEFLSSEDGVDVRKARHERCVYPNHLWLLLYNSSTRQWAVNGVIYPDDMKGLYHVNPATQAVSTHCLTAMREGKFLLLMGARASGKSTRLKWLQREIARTGGLAI